MASLPKVLLVGGPDVNARLELMHSISDTFEMSALGSLPALREKFSSEGFEYTSYTLGRGTNPFLDLFTLGQLVFIFRRLKPEIVHTFDTKPCVWARLAARLAGVPVIIGTLPGLGSLYSTDSFKNRLLRSLYQGLQSLACRFSDITIFQNHDDERQFIAAGIVSTQKSIVILSSGVSTDVFSPSQVTDTQKARLKNELGLRPEEVIITMISRVIRSKGIFEFMTAAQEVKRNCPNAHFLLIGPEDNENLDRLNTEELRQLKEIVDWPGSRRDIPAVLAISDIFVLPSAYREGIPRVLLEAASMGRPIVTTDSPGCNEVVENEVNGLLIPVRDADALSQAILRLVQQPELRQRFGQVSRQRAVERFDISAVAAQTRAVYQQLLTRKAARPTT